MCSDEVSFLSSRFLYSSTCYYYCFSGQVQYFKRDGIIMKYKPVPQYQLHSTTRAHFWPDVPELALVLKAQNFDDLVGNLCVWADNLQTLIIDMNYLATNFEPAEWDSNFSYDQIFETLKAV